MCTSTGYLGQTTNEVSLELIFDFCSVLLKLKSGARGILVYLGACAPTAARWGLDLFMTYSIYRHKETEQRDKSKSGERERSALP